MRLQPLPADGRGKEVADARPLRHPAVRRSQIERERARRKTVDCASDILGCRIVAFQKEVFDRSGAIDHLPHEPQKATRSGPRVHRCTTPSKAAA